MKMNCFADQMIKSPTQIPIEITPTILTIFEIFQIDLDFYYKTFKISINTELHQQHIIFLNKFVLAYVIKLQSHVAL